MFFGKAAYPRFPRGFMCGAAFEPGGVEAVPGAKCVAFPDAFEAEEEIAVVPGPDLLERIRKAQGRRGWEPEEFTLPVGPLGVGEKDGGMSGPGNSLGEPTEERFSAAAGGEAAPDEADSHGCAGSGVTATMAGARIYLRAAQTR